MSMQEPDNLSFATVPVAMLNDLPELRPSYLDVVARYGEEQRERTFVWAVIQEVLKPYVFSLLSNPTAEHTAIARSLRFVDRLVGHPDPDVRAVATVEILYPLATRQFRTQRERARPFMGNATLEALHGQEDLAAHGRRRVPLLQRIVQLLRR